MTLCEAILEREIPVKTPFSLRLPDTIRAWLITKASEEGRSMNSKIVQTLKAAMVADSAKENQQ
jgi:predicted HicB family RNase H-like nuclease